MFIKQDTEFLIEGYFRVGNTFAFRAFSVAQKKPVKLAFQTHAIASVLVAVKQNIPTLILVRKPADTVISAVMKMPGTTLKQHLRWYIRYYKKIHELRQEVYIALFEEVIQDFGRVLENVNQRFGTNFTPFEHTPEHVQDIFTWIEDIDQRVHDGNISQFSTPRQEKKMMQDDLKKQLLGENTDLLHRADQLYENLALDRWRR